MYNYEHDKNEDEREIYHISVFLSWSVVESIHQRMDIQVLQYVKLEFCAENKKQKKLLAVLHNGANKTLT